MIHNFSGIGFILLSLFLMCKFGKLKTPSDNKNFQIVGGIFTLFEVPVCFCLELTDSCTIYWLQWETVQGETKRSDRFTISPCLISRNFWANLNRAEWKNSMHQRSFIYLSCSMTLDDKTYLIYCRGNESVAASNDIL